MVSTTELLIILAAYMSNVVAAVISWQRVVARMLPLAAVVICSIVLISALNDGVTLGAWIYKTITGTKVVTYAMLRNHIYTVVEFIGLCVFSAISVKVRWFKVVAAFGAVVFVGVDVVLHILGIETVHYFDNVSSGIAALGEIALLYAVLWLRVGDIVESQQFRWLLILCLVMAGSCLLDFTVFFTYNFLQEDKKSLWWLHHCVSMIKYTGVSYCFGRLL